MATLADVTASWPKPLKKAVATLVFATTGALVGAPLFDMAVWKGAAAAGIGAVVNFVYRFAEEYLTSE